MNEAEREDLQLLEAENEKLREALERIVRMAASEGWDWRSAKREFTLVAREALGDSRDLG
jgi:hypothetical protein